MAQYDTKLISNLADQILHHKQLYYSGKPEISDAEYDQLEDKLRKLSPHHPALEFVGTEVTTSSKKVSHANPMLSLAKTYDLDELERWLKDYSVVGMQKIDGNSLSLIYEGGSLVLAKTRGNGRVGEDVTPKSRWIADLIPQLSSPYDVEIRGELFCSESNFIRLAKEFSALGLEKPTSPRNIVAGLLGRKSHLYLARYFSFYAFDVISEDSDLQFNTEMDKFTWLEKTGFNLPGPALLKNISEVKEFLDEVKVIMNQGEVGLDGAVFSYNDLNLHTELGNTSHHPRFKMSFKWQGETAQSKVEEIIWSTSRLGIVTPVAVIEPANLSGATITHVTLHNAAHVKLYDLKKGDVIELVRSGEVIPKYLRTIKSGQGESQLPESCPECGSPLAFDDVRLRCLNAEACPAQQSGAILNWIKCVGIDDLSEKRLGQMMDIGIVNSIPDLYRLTKDELLRLPQTKEKMADKLFKNIQASRKVDLAQFLNGLGIAGAGLTSWEKLLKEFKSLEALQSASTDDIAGVDGFAEKSADQIVTGLKRLHPMINELFKVGVDPDVSHIPSDTGPLSGKHIAITGSLSEPRSVFEKMIRDAGGNPTSSVSKNTFAVVTSDPTSSSSKMKKARELGVQIWGEDELRDVCRD